MKFNHLLLPVLGAVSTAQASVLCHHWDLLDQTFGTLCHPLPTVFSVVENQTFTAIEEAGAAVKGLLNFYWRLSPLDIVFDQVEAGKDAGQVTLKIGKSDWNGPAKLVDLSTAQDQALCWITQGTRQALAQSKGRRGSNGETLPLAPLSSDQATQIARTCWSGRVQTLPFPEFQFTDRAQNISLTLATLSPVLAMAGAAEGLVTAPQALVVPGQEASTQILKLRKDGSGELWANGAEALEAKQSLADPKTAETCKPCFPHSDVVNARSNDESLVRRGVAKTKGYCLQIPRDPVLRDALEAIQNIIVQNPDLNGDLKLDLAPGGSGPFAQTLDAYYRRGSMLSPEKLSIARERTTPLAVEDVFDGARTTEKDLVPAAKLHTQSLVTALNSKDVNLILDDLNKSSVALVKWPGSVTKMTQKEVFLELSERIEAKNSRLLNQLGRLDNLRIGRCVRIVIPRKFDHSLLDSSLSDWLEVYFRAVIKNVATLTDTSEDAYTAELSIDYISTELRDALEGLKGYKKLDTAPPLAKDPSMAVFVTSSEDATLVKKVSDGTVSRLKAKKNSAHLIWGQQFNPLDFTHLHDTNGAPYIGQFFPQMATANYMRIAARVLKKPT